ncbi:MAG TPA: amino acid ABC transporter permease [Lachnospiraceae bacterium]|nr:amino acid ABC transporter permease [Lachnospiraceae bacterium]
MPLNEWIPQMAEGCLLTLKLFAVTIVFSVPLGLLLTFLYTSKNKVVTKLISIYILLMRGTPLLLQIFFVYFGLPYLPVIGKYVTISSRFTAGAVAFIFNYAAYFAEIFRGGLLSVDKGQYEAAKVLGLSEAQTRFKIVLPQMFRISLPAVSNEAIILIKDTALVTAIGLVDLLKVTKTIVNKTTDVSAFLVAALFYLVLSYILTLVFKFLEKKFDY